jgi:cobalt transporter subunit CbtB
MSNASIDSNPAAPANPVDTNAAPKSNAAVRAHLWPVILASLLGTVIILGVGFGPGMAHNAAHDTRHTLAFPCH